MSDFQLLIEFCERFGYEYDIHKTYDGGYKVYSQGEEYYFDVDEALEQ